MNPFENTEAIAFVPNDAGMLDPYASGVWNG